MLSQIAETRQKIQLRRDELNSKKQELNNQTLLNKPELDFWQQVLGLHIQGQSEDFIKFVYTQIDQNDADKEYYFVLDLREHDYAISECKPEVSKEESEKILSQLNESRQLNVFLRDMRKLFKKNL